MDEKLVDNLFHAILMPNSRLRGPCGRVLRDAYSKAKYKPMIEGQFKKTKWEDGQARKIKQYMR